MLAVAVAMLLQAAPVSEGKAAPPAAPPPHPIVMTDADWLRRPSGEDLMRYLPDRAQRAGVEGQVTMTCVVTDKGQLSDCTVIEESPINYGFGAAAVKLGKLFRMRPVTRNGQPVAGGTVTIPMQFLLSKH